MFSGFFCLSGRFSHDPEASRICDCGEAVFHPVACDCFRGGYFLHPRLPYTSEDAYFRDDSDDILVLLDGSVYNRSDMAAGNGRSSGLRDPELIARLFLKEGPGFVSKLNGDFAIFIIRPGRHEAFLFRDHLGVRPLAFHVKGDSLMFSADNIGLCRFVSSGAPADSEFFLNYFRYTDYRKAPDPGVKKVMPGHYISFGPEGLKEMKYWFPEDIRTERKLSYDNMLSDLSWLLEDSVRIRCDSRFTAGAHVSGGLDSGVVSALARLEYSKQDSFKGFSWSPGEIGVAADDGDERELVLKSCGMASIEPLFSGMDEGTYKRYISRSYLNQGYFIEDETSDTAAGVGVNLLFSGWGGDEFISTGHSGIDLDLLRRFRLKAFFRRNPVGEPRKFARRVLFYVIYPAFHILDPRAARSFRRETRYLKESSKRCDRRAIASFYFHGSRRRMHLNVFRFYNLPERCESWHRMGFMKGVEYRYPLLDRRIAEYMLKVPSELLCRTGQFRPLLREIGKGILPGEVLANESKNDPLFWKNTADLNRSAAVAFMSEPEKWEKNPDLGFVDFAVLNDDIRRYREGLTVADSDLLFRSVVYIKAINEFTARYRKAGR